MEIDITVPQKINVKKLHFHCMPRDTCSVTIYDDMGIVVFKDEDSEYVPSFMPGDFGDYLELDIDLDTGKILNWKATAAHIERFIRARKIGERD